MKIEEKKNKAKFILKKLAKLYPEAKCHLEFKNVFELTISTVLSAQCTDEIVNKTMVPLYATRYKTPADIMNDGIDNFRDNIKSINFYNNKTKSVMKLVEKLITDFDSEIPESMEDLISLPGLGRKSANVILGNYFGKKDCVIVDTHFKRVASRLGIIENENPDKIESEIKELVNEKDQYDFSMRLGEHGRIVCNAKKPKCEICVFTDICLYYNESK